MVPTRHRVSSGRRAARPLCTKSLPAPAHSPIEALKPAGGHQDYDIAHQHIHKLTLPCGVETMWCGRPCLHSKAALGARPCPSSATRNTLAQAHQHHPQAGLQGVRRCLPPQLQVGQEQDGRCCTPCLHHGLQEGLLCTPAQSWGPGLHRVAVALRRVFHGCCMGVPR